MSLNFPGTFEVRFFYTTNEPSAIASHQTRLSCEMDVEATPGDPFSAWFPLQKDGSAPDNLQTHVDNWVDLFAVNYNTAVDFTRAELWEYAPGTFDSIFRSGYTLSVSGTQATATASMSQSIWTWRSGLGGILKLDLRGTIHPEQAKLSFPTASAAIDDVLDAMVDDTSIWHARDQGYALTGIFFLAGRNERAFKELNR